MRRKLTNEITRGNYATSILRKISVTKPLNAEGNELRQGLFDCICLTIACSCKLRVMREESRLWVNLGDNDVHYIYIPRSCEESEVYRQDLRMFKWWGSVSQNDISFSVHHFHFILYWHFCLFPSFEFHDVDARPRLGELSVVVLPDFVVTLLTHSICI